MKVLNAWESENQLNQHVLSIYLKKTIQRMKIIWHIPDALAKVVDGMMSERKVLQVIDKIDNKKQRTAPEGTWVSAGQIEIPSFIFCVEKG